MVWLNLVFASKVNLSPFLVQLTLGVGFPSTKQLKTTSPPSDVLVSFGCLEISGATGSTHKKKRKEKRKRVRIIIPTRYFLLISPFLLKRKSMSFYCKLTRATQSFDVEL